MRGIGHVSYPIQEQICSKQSVEKYLNSILFDLFEINIYNKIKKLIKIQFIKTII